MFYICRNETFCLDQIVASTRKDLVVTTAWYFSRSYVIIVSLLDYSILIKFIFFSKPYLHLSRMIQSISDGNILFIHSSIETNVYLDGYTPLLSIGRDYLYVSLLFTCTVTHCITCTGNQYISCKVSQCITCTGNQYVSCKVSHWVTRSVNRCITCTVNHCFTSTVSHCVICTVN